MQFRGKIKKVIHNFWYVSACIRFNFSQTLCYTETICNFKLCIFTDHAFSWIKEFYLKKETWKCNTCLSIQRKNACMSLQNTKMLTFTSKANQTFRSSNVTVNIKVVIFGMNIDSIIVFEFASEINSFIVKPVFEMLRVMFFSYTI